MGATRGTTGQYRLSGVDMQAFSGQQVQLTGTMGANGATTGAAGATPEFRVISVRPIGACPQR